MLNWLYLYVYELNFVRNNCFWRLKRKKYMNYYQSSKIGIDKSFSRGYNGIVNSKGAADHKSAVLFFWFIALIPYTKGCMMY